MPILGWPIYVGEHRFYVLTHARNDHFTPKFILRVFLSFQVRLVTWQRLSGERDKMLGLTNSGIKF